LLLLLLLLLLLPGAGFPPGPPGDQSLSLLSDPLACISRLRREHGPLVGLLLGGERVVLVADPEAAKQVCVCGGGGTADCVQGGSGVEGFCWEGSEWCSWLTLAAKQGCW
jgi:hypothetical protein